ncbi:MAG: hypothetical protein ACKPDM_21830, partial [Dolichospermum sp.]
QIYLSANFLATSTAEAISAVLLEEIGHYVDAQINQVDSAGDEGAIFAELVQGNSVILEVRCSYLPTQVQKDFMVQLCPTLANLNWD